MSILDKFKLAWYSSYKVAKFRETFSALLPKKHPTKIIFLFGCQRSGTTILQKIISLNPNVKFHGEGDSPYFYDSDTEKHHRLIPTNEVNQLIQKEHLKLITLKPLYESHFANKLIANYPNSKGIWVFRDYNEVIDSHIRYYKQNAIDYIKPLYSSETNSWLNESLTEEVIKLISILPLEELSDADAYGLFWIARNSIFLEAKDNKNILLINHRHLVESPENQITIICDFIGLPAYNFYSKAIHKKNSTKRLTIQLKPEIQQACEKIYQQLNNECQ